MTNSLHSTLNDLATSFADSVLATIRSASLDELVQPNGRGPSAARSVRATRTAAASPAAKKPAVTRTGRLPRRTPEQIANVLEQVVSLVKKHKTGLRAEQIRSELGLQAKEMPRILKDGLASKALRSKGQKRATTYFAS
jgi:hypothetical protein